MVPPSFRPADNPLGTFLRSRRERLDPTALGLPTLRRRRTPGLRREEVAEAAGISVEWYVKLEQGRAVAPPNRTIDALAWALKLDEGDHAHLRRLAGPAPVAPFQREQVPATVRRMIGRMPFPAYLTGRRWDVLACNAAAAELFGDFGAIAGEHPNILLFALTHPAAKTLFGAGWSIEAKRITALFRSTFDLFAHDPAFVELVSRARRGCASFDGWWADHDIRTPSSGIKTLHTRSGVCRYEYTSFQANDDPALKLAIYMPT
jgi:transcriptional regulator with XRE-family HTH domain